MQQISALMPGAGQSLGAKIVDTGVPAEIAGRRGGAGRLPEEAHQGTGSIERNRSKADIIILTALSPAGKLPFLSAKKWSVYETVAIIDTPCSGRQLAPNGGKITDKSSALTDKKYPGMVPTSST